jgi:hypothetical protein
VRHSAVLLTGLIAAVAPQVVAEIESQLQSAMAGAATADADRVLAIAGGKGELTFITGDVLLSGLDTIRTSFEDTCAGIAKQDQTKEF